MNPITVFLTIACLVVGAVLGAMGYLVPAAALLVVAIVIASALKMANTWQKFVILRAAATNWWVRILDRSRAEAKFA
jgi:hypothetical protein